MSAELLKPAPNTLRPPKLRPATPRNKPFELEPALRRLFADPVARALWQEECPAEDPAHVDPVKDLEVQS